MGSLRSGLASQLTVPVVETTYGVAPSFAGAKFVVFEPPESLGLTKKSVQGAGIQAGKLHATAARRVITGWTAGGGVNMELPARGLQQWLSPMLGSYGQTPATLTQDGATGAYKAIHAPGPLEGNSFALQKGVPTVDNGTVEPFTYVGCKITDWELSVEKEAIAKLALTIDARNELGGAMNSDPLNGSLPALATYSDPPGGVFHFAEAQLYTGGTVSTSAGVTTVSSPVLAGQMHSAKIKYTTPLNTERYFLGKAGFKDEQLQNATRQISGEFVVEWLSSEARYNAFAADTPTALKLAFVGPAIGSGSDFSTLEILIPDIFLEGKTPEIGGTDVVTQTVPFTGLDDGTNNPIQATYWTLDAA